MNGRDLKPWTFAPVVTAILIVAVLFVGGVGAFMVTAAPSLKVTLVSKLLVVLLAVVGTGGAVSTLMWSRHWRHVQWEGSFRDFVSGPPPPYEEALRAWRWGRRFQLCWKVTMASMAMIAVVELVAGNWR